VTAGLALLSKSPAVFLLLFVPLSGWMDLSPPAPLPFRGGGPGGRGPSPGLGGRGLDVALWLAALALTVVALWPAIWALGPGEVLDRVADFTRETGGQPHEAGTFFWGEPRTDPGPLFYPVALLFRLAPLTLFGLGTLAIFWRRIEPARRPTVLALIAYCLGFLLMMTLGAKKFDRYLLPLFPALGVLAAAGISQSLMSALSGAGARRATLQVVAALAVFGLAVWPLVSVYPYPLAYYNPLLGGGAAAQRAVMVGNGEGLDQVAHWLNGRPNAENLRVAAHSYDILQALFVGSGERLDNRVPSDADYVVLYRFQMQIGQHPRVLAEYAGQEPELRVWIDGVEYARVYRGPHLAAGAPSEPS
jgi:hypothetical protein